MKTRKHFIFLVSLLLIISLGGAPLVKGVEIESSNLKITYLDEMTPQTISGMRSRSSETEPILLDTEQDAYVLNQYSFSMLDEANTADYLNDGGIIVVNDNEVTSEELKSKVDTDVAEFDYSDKRNHYGFYLYNNGEKNVTVNVALGYLYSDQEEQMEEIIVANEIEKETIVEDIVSCAMVESRTSPFIDVTTGNEGGGGAGAGGTVNPTDTSGQVIATAYLQNILYINENGEKACSYTIYTQVVDVAKVQDSLDIVHGVYDVVSTFTLDAEENYCIINYGVRMRSVSTILDASYLNSSTSTTISLGGTIGFQGNVIQGSFNSGASYTYTPDSQEILNDLPAGYDKYWYSEVVDPIYNASRQLTPSIRIMNNSDDANTYEYSRVEELYVQDDAWWIFRKTYSMDDEYRKELAICWNSEGFISQTTNVG